MPSKTFSYRRELFKQDFRNVGWIGIVFLLGLLFVLPLQLILMLNDPIQSNRFLTQTTYTLFDPNGFMFPIQVILIFTVPVLMAIFLFRYLHVKEAADFTHSLPVKRGKIYLYKLLSGLFFLWVPIILTALVMLLFLWFGDMGGYFTYEGLYLWVFLMMTVTLLVFASGVFAGMVTGLSVLQGGLTYIFLLFPIGIYGLLAYQASVYVSGLQNFLDISEVLSPISDIARTSAMDEMPIASQTLICYIGISILLLATSYLLYKNRRLESATQAMAYPGLKPIFIYGVTYCFALAGGLYFGETERTYGWIIAGNVLGIIIGFFLGKMIVEKSWRVFSGRYWLSLVKYGVAAALLLVITPFLWKGYESYVPEPGQVERAYISNNFYEWEMEHQEDRLSYLTSPESIQALTNLHRELIDQADPLKDRGRNYYVRYELANGNVIERTFIVSPEQVSEQFQTLYEVEGYKEMKYPVLNLPPSEVNVIELHSFLGQNHTQIGNLEQIEQLLEALKKDLSNLTYEETTLTHGVPISVNIESNVWVGTRDVHPINYHISVDSSYDHTIEWLKSNGYYEEVFTVPGDFHHADVYRTNQGSTNMYSLADEHMGNPLVTVTEPEKIKDLLIGSEAYEGEGYIVAFYQYENEKEPPYVIYLPENKAPSFLTENLSN